MTMPVPPDSMTASRFSITIDGYEIASFSALQGITTEVEPVEHVDSGDREFAKLPGKAKPPTLVLKRGKNSSMELWTWHETVRRGQLSAARKSCSLTMYNPEGKPVAKYWLENAWPSKLEISAVKAGRSEVMFETVTIVCESLQRVSV